MSRVSHLRSLFEEKVRQANEEKERANGQVNSAQKGVGRRGSIGSKENLFGRSHLNGSNNSVCDVITNNWHELMELYCSYLIDFLKNYCDHTLSNLGIHAKGSYPPNN